MSQCTGLAIDVTSVAQSGWGPQASQGPLRVWWTADTNAGSIMLELLTLRAASFTVTASRGAVTRAWRVRSPGAIEQAVYDCLRQLNVWHVAQWRQEAFERG